LSRFTKPLLIRADGGGSTGLGHLMRCLALAQEWRSRGGQVSLLSREIPEATRDRFLMEGIQPLDPPIDSNLRQDAHHLAETASSLRAAVVIDGYVFDGEYQRVVRPYAIPLLVLDDHGEIGSYDADLILDQNLGAEVATYDKRPADCSVLLGLRYTLLRTEFLQHSRTDRNGHVNKILVTFGGSDRTNEASKVVQAISEIQTGDLEVRVVVGAGSPTAGIVDEGSRGVNWLRVDHAIEDMAPVVAWADLVVSAAGSACWEFAYMGLPMVLMPIAANQNPIARALETHGAAVNLGSHADVGRRDITDTLRKLIGSPDRLRHMSTRALNLVDGFGPRRVIDALLDRSAG